MNRIYILGILIISILPIFAQADWQTVTAADVILQYRIMQDSQNLECILSGETTGWIAVGFNPVSVMRSANIIIAYVNGENTTIRDDWGTTNTAHASDLSMGGSSDVTLISGMESGGVTTVRFSIPLQTSDQYDRPLSIGQSYPIILARGANGQDNFTGMHADADFAQITLTAPVANSDDFSLIPIDRIIAVYPNPVSNTANIDYEIKGSGSATLSVYNLHGQKVRTISHTQGKGMHSLKLNSGNLANGIYYLSLKSSTGEQVRRITILRR